MGIFIYYNCNTFSDTIASKNIRSQPQANSNTVPVETQTQRTDVEQIIQIFIRGLDGKTRAYNVNSQCTIGEVKHAIEEREGIPGGAQRLMYAGKQLEDEKELVDYGITKESTLHLALRFHFKQVIKSDNNNKHLVHNLK